MSMAVTCCYIMPVRADVNYVAEGVNAENVRESERFYDTGKGYYWSWSLGREGLARLARQHGNLDFLGDLNRRVFHEGGTLAKKIEPLTGDSDTCWAQSAANVVEYWQSYYGVFCKDSRDLLYGYNYDKQYVDDLDGTLSLKQSLVIQETFSNDGDNFISYASWFFTGDDTPYYADVLKTGQGGYWKAYFKTSGSTYKRAYFRASDAVSVAKLATSLMPLLGYTQNANGEYELTTKGQIVAVSMDGYTNGNLANERAGHGITCYGAELDDQNQVKAIYVTNSDDIEYKLFKLYVKVEQNRLWLYTDEACTERWEYAQMEWNIGALYTVNTPAVLKSMLAEYEDVDNELYWTGTATDGKWDLTSAPVIEVLPDESTGWEIMVDGDMYPVYYDSERLVVFDDGAGSGNVLVANSGSVRQMELNNRSLEYAFTGGGSNTLHAESFAAAGGGSASFHNITLQTDSTYISNYTLDFGKGSKWTGQATLSSGGAVKLNGGSLSLPFDSGLRQLDFSWRQQYAEVLFPYGWLWCHSGVCDGCVRLFSCPFDWHWRYLQRFTFVDYPSEQLAAGGGFVRSYHVLNGQ